jgi:O-antigen/teichoic acid export membrane protein
MASIKSSSNLVTELRQPLVEVNVRSDTAEAGVSANAVATPPKAKSDVDGRPRTRVLKHFSFYFSSRLLMTLASFISFPINTRIFTRAQYGMLSIADTTLSFAASCAKLGIQHSALRYYAEFQENKRDLDITYYYGTTLIAVLLTSAVVTLAYAIGLELIFNNSQDREFVSVLRFMTLLIFLNAVERVCFSFLRAEEKSKLYSLLDLMGTYLGILSVVFFVVLLKFGVLGFFIGRTIIFALICVYIITKLVQSGKLRFTSFSFPLFKELLAYGLPLFCFELSSTLLSLGDRYILQYYMGESVVGLYAAAASLANYAVACYAEPMALAIVPIYLRLWEKQGKLETSQFLSEAIKYHLIISIPVLFGLSVLGRQVLVLLASNEFEAGYQIIPLVAAGFIVYNAHYIYAAGLYIKKKTSTLMAVNLTAATINIALNFFLIPRYGLMGTAVSTLIAHLFLMIITTICSNRIIHLRLPFQSILKYVGLSFLMIIVVNTIPGNGLGMLFTKVLIGFLTYSAGILLIEPELRVRMAVLVNRINDRRLGRTKI